MDSSSNPNDQTLNTMHVSSAPDTRPGASETVDVTTPLIPGYVVESELGRGGMGVVYKARQEGLNRIVALKMIKQADLANTEDRLRFLREAKALASLEHPNIVRVYEVGEHEGKPYFSMEFVGGGALDKRLKEHPPSERESAALVETLARAMQAAHEAGIVHRDLKPANVLLSAGSMGDGSQPHAAISKITDFGLAKDLRETGQTQSGEVMGTPQYMAPEQAAGRVHEIDARTDVYALGVILYECLTGRPPFRAASTMETLLQVMNEEPTTVRQFKRVHPDLETICHKCLQKDPARRYLSALHLAEDLRRFLAGEPIVARPVTTAERFRRWCRRNPTVAGLVAAVFLALVGGTVVSTSFMFQARDNARTAEDNAAQARTNEQRAEEKERDARRLATYATRQRDLALDSINALLLAVQQKLRETPEHRQVKDELLQTAVQALARLSERGEGEDVPADPGLVEVHARLAASFTRIGNMEMGRKEYERALDALSYVLKEQPKERKYLLQRETMTAGLVSLLAVLDPKKARAMAEESAERLDRMAREAPDESDVAQALATACQNVARQLRADNDLKGAREQLQRAVSLTDRLSKAEPNNRDRRMAVAFARNALGELLQQTKELDESRKAFETARDIAKELAAKDAQDTQARAAWMANLVALAGVAEDASGVGAIPAYKEALNRCWEMVALEPYNMLHQIYAAQCCKRLAELHLKRDQDDDKGWAREHVVQALFAVRRVHGSEPNNPEYRKLLRELHEAAGRISLAWGGVIAARNHYWQATIQDIVIGGVAPDEANRRGQLDLQERLCDLAIRLENYAAARDHLKGAVALARGLGDEKKAAELEGRAKELEGKTSRVVRNSVGMDLIAIKPGTYQRGGEQEPKVISEEFREAVGLWANEHPRHEVMLTKRFEIGVTEVTRGQFRTFVLMTGYRTDAEKDGKGLGSFNPSGQNTGQTMMDWRGEGDVFLTDDHAVIGVSWNDAVAYCQWLSKKEGKKYRLPTEAEWEYCCRAGTTTRYFSGESPESLLKYANIPDASYKDGWRGPLGYDVLKGRDGLIGLAPVGEFAPNPFGLYDMTGNVWEWCLDGYEAKIYEQKVKEDPRGPEDRPTHVMRGGCYM